PVESIPNVNDNATVQTTSLAINSDFYTVVATDDFGCQNYKSFFLPFLNAHQLNVLPVNVTDCTLNNGGLSTFTNPPAGAQANQSQYKLTFFKGGTNNPANKVDLLVPGATFTGYYGADTNPNNWPLSNELCGDGVDNDLDGDTDGNDKDCGRR